MMTATVLLGQSLLLEVYIGNMYLHWKAQTQCEQRLVYEDFGLCPYRKECGFDI